MKIEKPEEKIYNLKKTEKIQKDRYIDRYKEKEERRREGKKLQMKGRKKQEENKEKKTDGIKQNRERKEKLIRTIIFK